MDDLEEEINLYLQWTLNTVKDTTHDSWTQFNRERLTCPKHRITDHKTSCVRKILGEKKKKKRKRNIKLHVSS